MALYLGVDVGGTFTDLVVYDDATQTLTIRKVPTHSTRPEEGVIQAVEAAGVELGSCRIIVHATTIATNALLTRTGLGRVALITNRGFRDVLEIGRQRRPELYDPFFTRPKPLVDRVYRYTLNCRMNHVGERVLDPAPKELKRLCEKLVNQGFDSIAIVFLHSYANPQHEKDVADALKNAGFRGQIVLSSDVDPYYREYERTSTTVVSAALAPLVSSYIHSLEMALRERGFRGELYIMCSDGGAANWREVAERPVSIIESGPAAGVLASAHLAKRIGIENVITFDMGGTTAKAGVVLGGQPQVVYEFEAAGKSHSGRSIKGSGYTVRYPFIDLAEVSAGGGTVAWVDEGGGLRVGPRSAGAEPGPAAYGRGGVEPTVTDANLLLGRLNPRGLLDSKMRLYPELAEKALSELGIRLGLGAEEAAISVVRLINTVMGRAIELVSVDRGRDPREFTLIAFGGAGPMHACDLAEEAGITRIVVPPDPGVFSAYGLLTTDLTRYFGRTVMCDPQSVEREFSAFREGVKSKLAEEGVKGYSLSEYVDLRYTGQSYELTLPYTPNFIEEFGRAHKAAYGFAAPDPVEVVSIRIKATVSLPKLSLVDQHSVGERSVWEPVERRRAWLGGSFMNAPIYRRGGLGGGFEVEGPAIIEEYTSTTIVNPGWKCSVDRFGVITLRR
ncbi:MAG: hydantoinase/oxoprolinase family protein [Thermoprotei archaeon]